MQMLVIDLPVWLRKNIDKPGRGFLWENKEVATGGKCLVNCKAICGDFDKNNPFGKKKHGMTL
jgi:hypothetical protein